MRRALPTGGRLVGRLPRRGYAAHAERVGYPGGTRPDCRQGGLTRRAIRRAIRRLALPVRGPVCLGWPGASRCLWVRPSSGRPPGRPPAPRGSGPAGPGGPAGPRGPEAGRGQRLAARSTQCKSLPGASTTPLPARLLLPHPEPAGPRRQRVQAQPGLVGSPAGPATEPAEPRGPPFLRK